MKRFRTLRFLSTLIISVVPVFVNRKIIEYEVPLVNIICILFKGIFIEVLSNI